MSSHLHLAPPPARLHRAAEAGHPVRVVLAESHAGMRRSLRVLLDGEADVQVVAEVDELSTAMDAVDRHQPRVLVLDPGMHHRSSLAAIRHLRAHAPGSQIVVLTMEDSAAFARGVLDAGAVGVVLKDRADTELTEAVRNAARGEEYISAHVRAGLKPAPSDSGRQLIGT